MYRLIRRILAKYYLHLFVIISIGVLAIVASLSFVIISKRFIDAATSGNNDDLLIYGIYLLIAISSQIVLSLANRYISNLTYVAISNFLREKVYIHTLYTKWSEMKEVHSADIITRLIKDIDDIVGLLVNSLPNIFLSLLQLLVTVIALYYLNPIIAILIALGTPFIAIFSKIYFRKMRKITDDIKKTESKISEQVQESLSNYTIIKAFERQSIEVYNLNKLQRQLYYYVKKRSILSVFNSLVYAIAFNGGYIMTFLWSGVLLVNNNITFGTMTAYLQLVHRIQNPVQSLISVLPGLVVAKSSFDRLNSILNMDREISQNSHILSSKGLRLDIQNLNFKYEDSEKLIYKDFNLSIKSGQIVGFLGETGSGKTTFLRLLLGFLSPNSGSIKIINDKEELSINEYTRVNFVYVPQGASLFSGTIRENLLVGNPKANDEELYKVLSIAEAHFVNEKEEGLDYVISERGTTLSEGQAQRIAIARSLLRKGNIFLFDEATSALDEDTEIKFIRNIKENYKDKIIIFITHHRNILDNFDSIIQLG